MAPRSSKVKLKTFLPLIFLLFLSACSTFGPAAPAPPVDGELVPRTLYELGGLETIREIFIEDTGRTRLVLLLSPT